MKQKKIKFQYKLCIWIFIGASIALNGYLIHKSILLHKNINQLRLDPLESRRLKKITADFSPQNRPLIILFGDSRIAQWRPQLNLPGWTVINRGIGGQTSTQLLLRLKNDVLDYKPEVVILQAGINDLKTIALFPKRQNDIIRHCKKNILEIIEKLSENKIKTVLLTIFPTEKPGLIRSMFWSSETDMAIRNVNDTLASAKMNNLLIIDTDTILSDGHYAISELTMDMLHLNPKGYERLNELLLPYIKNIHGHSPDPSLQ